jgi:O-antigen/teichoic acid export membrane protein
MRAFKKIFRNTFYLSVSQVVNKLLYLVLMMVMARKLGVDGLGNYAFVFAFISIVFPFTELGLTNLTVRTIARHKAQSATLIGNVIAIRLIAFAVVAVLATIYITTVGNLKAALLLSLLIMLCMSLLIIFNSVFRAFEKMEYQAMVEIAQSVVTVALGVVFLAKGGGLLSLMVAFVLGNMAALAVAIRITCQKYRPQLMINFVMWKSLLKDGFYFWMAFLFALVVYNADMLMLFYLKGSEVTGLYKAAYTIVKNVEILPPLFVMALYPQFSRFWVSNRKGLVNAYRKAFGLMLLAAVAIVAGVILLAKPLIFLVFGDMFKQSVLLLQMLSLTILFFLLNTLNGHYLFAVNRQREHTIFAAIGVALNVMLNLALIPTYGAYGAVISTTFAFFVTFVARQVYILRINSHISRLE